MRTGGTEMQPDHHAEFYYAVLCESKLRVSAQLQNTFIHMLQLFVQEDFE